MSISHLLEFEDPYSSILNGGFDNLKANNFYVSNIFVTNLSVSSLNVLNSIYVSYGDQYSLSVNTSNNTNNSWISGKFGCESISDKFVVFGNLNNNPIIGGHIINQNIVSWSDLFINPGANSYFGGFSINSPKTLNVIGDINITGNYFKNGLNISSQKTISFGPGKFSNFSSPSSLSTLYSFLYDPSINGNLFSFTVTCGPMNSGRTFDWQLVNTFNNSVIYTASNIFISNSAITYPASFFSNLPSSFAILAFKVKTFAGGEDFGNVYLNFQ